MASVMLRNSGRCQIACLKATPKPPAVRYLTVPKRQLPCASATASDLGTNAWSDKEVDRIWESVPRPLMRLGKSGANVTHYRSLQELLQAHLLVKVQLNADPNGAQGLGEELAKECEARLIGVRGRNILLARGTIGSSEVLDFAESELVKITKYHEKRKNRHAPVEDREDREDTRIPRAGRPGLPSRSGPPSRASSPRGGSQARQPEGRSASQKGPGIDEIISASMTKGPMTKDTLKQDWVKLAGEIKKQELIEEKSKRPGAVSPTNRGASGASGGRRQSKAPWRKNDS